MLAGLGQLTAISLGVHGCWGSELDREFPDRAGNEHPVWQGFAQLPPLASLTALTELTVTHRAGLPPDFRQLHQLQRLTVNGAHGTDWGPFAWGTDSLAGLTALTRVDLFQWSMDEGLPGETQGGKDRLSCLAAIRLVQAAHSSAPNLPACRPCGAGLRAPPCRGS